MLKDAAWMYSVKLKAKLQSANLPLPPTPTPNPNPNHNPNPNPGWQGPLLKEGERGPLNIFMKGADNFIMERLHEDEQQVTWELKSLIHLTHLHLLHCGSSLWRDVKRSSFTTSPNLNPITLTLMSSY